MVDPSRSEALARRFHDAAVLVRVEAHFSVAFGSHLDSSLVDIVACDAPRVVIPQQWPNEAIAEFIRSQPLVDRPAGQETAAVGESSLCT